MSEKAYCPFCGHEMVIERFEPAGEQRAWTAWASCRNCLGEGPYVKDAKTEADAIRMAIEAVNRRTDPITKEGCDAPK